MQAADEQAKIYGGCGPRLNEAAGSLPNGSKKDNGSLKAKLANEKELRAKTIASMKKSSSAGRTQ